MSLRSYEVEVEYSKIEKRTRGGGRSDCVGFFWKNFSMLFKQNRADKINKERRQHKYLSWV